MKSTCLLTLSFLLIEGWSINLWHENRNPQFILNETQKHSTLSPIKSEKLKKELSSKGNKEINCDCFYNEN